MERVSETDTHIYKNQTISVIVPVYNAEETLRKCVNSILEQTYTNIEIILVDDGSDDSSPIVCDEFSSIDSRVKVIHQDNLGPSHARNNGIKASTGNYIVFIDSDDYVASNYLETLFETVKKYGDDSLIISRYTLLYNDEEKKSDEINEIVELDENEFFRLIFGFYLDVPWNKLYIRDQIIDNNILFDTRYSSGEDLLFNLDYIEKNHHEKLVLLPYYGYYYKKGNNGSLSEKKRENQYLEKRFIFQRLRKVVKLKNSPDELVRSSEGLFIEFLIDSMKYNENNSALSRREKNVMNSMIMRENDMCKVVKVGKGYDKIKRYMVPFYIINNYSFIKRIEIIMDKLYECIKGKRITENKDE